MKPGITHQSIGRVCQLPTYMLTKFDSVLAPGVLQGLGPGEFFRGALFLREFLSEVNNTARVRLFQPYADGILSNICICSGCGRTGQT